MRSRIAVLSRYGFCVTPKVYEIMHCCALPTRDCEAAAREACHEGSPPRGISWTRTPILSGLCQRGPYYCRGIRLGHRNRPGRRDQGVAGRVARRRRAELWSAPHVRRTCGTVTVRLRAESYKLHYVISTVVSHVGKGGIKHKNVEATQRSQQSFLRP